MCDSLSSERVLSLLTWKELYLVSLGVRAMCDSLSSERVVSLLTWKELNLISLEGGALSHRLALHEM